MMSPPIAGDTTASILASEKSAASACPSFSAKRGYCKTSAHWTYVPLCSPLDNSKCPCRIAPAVSNIFSNSSRFSISAQPTAAGSQASKCQEISRRFPRCQGTEPLLDCFLRPAGAAQPSGWVPGIFDGSNRATVRFHPEPQNVPLPEKNSI